MNGLQAIMVSAACALSLGLGILMGQYDSSPIQLTGQYAIKLALAVDIARMYGLSKEQTYLLLAIERHEAGRAGLEWGVHNNPYSDGNRSYLWACARACESIKARCQSVTESGLKQMGSRYASDPKWYVKVKRHLKVVKRQVIVP